MQEVGITYRDQTQNTLHVYEASPSKQRVVCILPAMGVRASYYKALAVSLQSKGITCINADYRGQGSFSIRPGRQVNFGYEDLILDVKELVDFASNRYPAHSLYLLGHSLGGQIGSLSAARFPESVKGLILCAACSVYYKGWPGYQSTGLRVVSHLMYPLSQVVGYFPGNVVGFGGKEARGVVRDWCRNVRSGRYELSDSGFDYESALAKQVFPVFAASMEGDWLATPLSVKNLFQKFHPDSPVTYTHLTPEALGIPNLDHFTWAKYPKAITQKIVDWLP